MNNSTAKPKRLGEVVKANPEQPPALIDGLLLRGQTMNILNCAFVVIQHALSGRKASDFEADIESCVDTHVALRPQKEKDIFVMETTKAAARSLPPVPPIRLRRALPVWNRADA